MVKSFIPEPGNHTNVALTVHGRSFIITWAVDTCDAISGTVLYLCHLSWLLAWCVPSCIPWNMCLKWQMMITSIICVQKATKSHLSTDVKSVTMSTHWACHNKMIQTLQVQSGMEWSKNDRMPSNGFCDCSFYILNSYSASRDNWFTVGGNGGCRVGEVRAGPTSPIPDHKGFKL